jgi:hypothetical protein
VAIDTKGQMYLLAKKYPHNAGKMRQIRFGGKWFRDRPFPANRQSLPVQPDRATGEKLRAGALSFDFSRGNQSRVTRLGEFSPMGRLFSSRSFFFENYGSSKKKFGYFFPQIRL